MRFCLLIFLLLAACAPQSPTELPTLAVLDTPEDHTATPQIPSPVAVPVVTVEQVSPPEVVTQEAAYVLVTPTSPPSKTPTPTHTPTQTFTFTPEPTEPTTATATATALIPPTRYVPFITAVVAQPAERVCDSTWFFIEPRPANCPATVPTVSQATFQEFERGLMIWIQQQDRIYVMYYNDLPAWESYEDPYDEWMPETDQAWEEPAGGGIFQPRRGFGEIWRRYSNVRERIGWAVERWEDIYSSTAQTADDGTIFLQDPDGGVVALMPGQQDWQRYAGSGSPTRLQLELIPTLTATPG